MGSSDALPPLPKAARKGATRAAFVAAAHALARRGTGADPLDPAAVTAEAGTSRPLFYAHFPSRGDFVEALLASIHEDGPRALDTPAGDSPAAGLLEFFDRLAAPLDRHAALARALIPASHLPGPVAEARAERRRRAVARVADLLPARVPEREARAAFLMDAFLGLQLAWSKGTVPGDLRDRVRRELPWAIAGVLAAAPSPLPAPIPVPPPRPVSPPEVP